MINDEEKRSIKRREAVARAKAIDILSEAHARLTQIRNNGEVRPYWGPAEKAAEKVEALIIEMGEDKSTDPPPKVAPRVDELLYNTPLEFLVLTVRESCPMRSKAGHQLPPGEYEVAQSYSSDLGSVIVVRNDERGATYNVLVNEIDASMLRDGRTTDA